MAKIQTPQAVRGTQDMFGETEERFAHVVATFERVRRLYGFKGLQLPVIEPTAVFSRSLGEATDVVSKEMYTFEDRGGDSITLRPEFTAGIARAYLTNGWQQFAPNDWLAGIGLAEPHTATALSKTRRDEAAADEIDRGRGAEQPSHHCQGCRRPFSEFEPC